MCGGHGPRKKLSVFEPEREPTEPRMFLVKRLHNGTGTTRARERVAHTSEGGEGRLGACWVQCMRHARVRLEIVAEFRRSHLSRAAQDLLLTDGGRKDKSPQVPPLQERQLREERPQILVACRSLFKTATPPSPTDRPTDRPAEPTGPPCPSNYTPYHLLVQNLAHITVHFLFVLSYTQVLGARNEFQ